MEFDRHELRRDGGDAASFHASTYYGARYPSDDRLNRQGVGPARAGPFGRDSLISPSYREDRELEIRRFCLREISDRIWLAHYRMLEEHDRRAFAIAESDPYACHIPLYPELPPDNSQFNHTEKAIQHSRSPQRVAPMYHVGEKHTVQKDLNLEPQRGPRVGIDGPSILRREEHALELRNGARSLCQPIEPAVAVRPVEPARNVWIDETMARYPILQDQFTGYNVMLPSQIMHEPPPPPVMPVPVPIIGKVGSSANTNKKRKKEYGHEVIEVQPTMKWSKWSCVWCSVNFDSKEAMDAHLQEQHQGCKDDGQSKPEKIESNRGEEAKTGATAVSDGDKKKVGSSADTNKKHKKEAMDAHLQEQHPDSEGNGPSEPENVEDNRTEEARTSLTVVGDGDQKISEVSGPHTNKRIQLDLLPANSKQKSDELHKGDVTSKKIQLELPPFSLKRTYDKAYEVQTPENKETAGSSTTKKIKLDLPVLTVQTPKHKEIAGSNIRRKKNLHLPPAYFKEKPGEPSKVEVMPISGSEVEPATDTTEPGCIGPEGGWFCDLCKVNTLTKRALEDHFQSNAHLGILHALLNGSKKSEPANKIVAEKPVQGISQAVSLSELEEPKEENSKSVPMPQLDKKVAEKPVQRVSQAVSLPKLEESKEETSKSLPIPQLDKKVTSQNKGNPSSSSKTVVPTGHKKTVKPKPNFSREKNGGPVCGITKPVLVMKDGKWFCNLCDAKRMTYKCKEDHIKGKRHKQNLQAQAGQAAQTVAHRLEAAKPTSRLHWCFVCNISCTNEDNLIAHFKGKKHREVLKYGFVAGPGAFNQ